MRNNNPDFGHLEYARGIYDVQLISSYLLSTSANNNLAMDLERTQRLLYYIQAKYLYINKLPLFSDKILAGPKGPFITKSYLWLKKEIYGNNRATNFTFIGYLDDWIREDDKLFIDEVVKTFQSMSTLELSEKTREEEPWLLTYEEGEENHISNSLIYEYFTNDMKHSSRLYGVYDDLDQTDIVNMLSRDPKVYHFSGPYPKKDFESYVEAQLQLSGLKETKYNSINDVLGYVSDFLIYKERSVTIKEMQVILFYIQKMFLKLLNKICFNEFIYKTEDAVAIGTLPELYTIDSKKIDEELAREREYDYPNTEREHITEIVRIKLLEKKANKYAKEKFKQDELEIMDVVLNKLIEYPGFHIINLVHSEKSWIKARVGETITVRSIYNS